MIEQDSQTKRYDVFLSHASEDKGWVERLAKRLKEEGVSVWYDDWAIDYGAHINVEINKGIENSRKIIAIFSSNYFGKKWTRSEIFAKHFKDPLAEERLIIPILLTDCKIDPTLESLRFVDFRNDKDFDYAFEKLLKVIAPVSQKIQNARHMEKDGTYSEAIEVWKQIKKLDPENPEVISALEQLTQKVEQKEEQKDSVDKTLKALMERKKDLKSMYMKVARSVKAMKIKGEDEIVLDMINGFLKGDLTADEFIEMWQEDTGSAVVKEKPEYETIAKRLNRGQLIPFLGSEALHLSGIDFSVSQILFQKLAEKSEYSDFQDSLPFISHYYQMKTSRDDLISIVKEVVEPDSVTLPPNPLYQLLAYIESPLLIIATFYDSQIERAFAEEKKNCVVISHYTDVRRPNDYGKILIKYSDRPTPEEPCPAESLTGLNLLDKGYSIIYKICGDVTLYNTSRTIDSFMISEVDFFKFSVMVSYMFHGLIK